VWPRQADGCACRILEAEAFGLQIPILLREKLEGFLAYWNLLRRSFATDCMYWLVSGIWSFPPLRAYGLGCGEPELTSAVIERHGKPRQEVNPEESLYRRGRGVDLSDADRQLLDYRFPYRKRLAHDQGDGMELAIRPGQRLRRGVSRGTEA
jgi:hypothetical protein